MSEPKNFRRRHADQQRSGAAPSQQNGGVAPLWSDGIKGLYDSVTQEPLPAEFIKLLERLAKKGRK